MSIVRLTLLYMNTFIFWGNMLYCSQPVGSPLTLTGSKAMQQQKKQQQDLSSITRTLNLSRNIYKITMRRKAFNFNQTPSEQFNPYNYSSQFNPYVSG